MYSFRSTVFRDRFFFSIGFLVLVLKDGVSQVVSVVARNETIAVFLNDLEKLADYSNPPRYGLLNLLRFCKFQRLARNAGTLIAHLLIRVRLQRAKKTTRVRAD